MTTFKPRITCTRINGYAACFGFALVVAAPMASADFFTGFEPGEGYVGAAGSAGEPPGPSQLVPQNGWTTQFGLSFDVFTYDGAQIPWKPPGLGVVELYPLSPKTLPINPNGGEQFVALGTSDAPSNSGARQIHEIDVAPALLEVSADYCNAYDGDYPPRQGQVRASGSTGDNMGIGIYTGDTLTDPLKWTFNVDAYDMNGVKISNHENYYSFEGVVGFDNLPREQWHRIGVVVDLDPASPTYRRIIQFKSQELIEGGQIWIMDMPQAMVGDPAVPTDMYIEGGANGASLPTHAGIYNVGNGTISMFDNVHVGAPYEWQVVQDVPFAITAIVYDPDAETVTLTWRSRPRTTYSAFSSLDLSDWSNELADSLGIDEDENPDDGAQITVTLPLTDGLENATDLFLRIQAD